MLEKLKFRLFLYLLKWYCRDVDQFDHFKLKVDKTTYYIGIELGPFWGYNENNFREIE